ncbi:hypothetical protein CGGC5_v009269 [Colletotrichum fructicola Nara gc5]|uniref:Uncharacterized protein n=1 Tax=Colletotrichum fructicola (strain Nara gc5) TaxID=1213859 RepID=A0A7J6IZ22_COLFN|nr:hypothetical protein CGGC5_v009269 [Colletotrichum fructicola Nara gc5]
MLEVPPPLTVCTVCSQGPSTCISILLRCRFCKGIDRQGRKNTHLFSPTLCFPARGFNRSQAGGSRHARVRRLSFSDCLVQF